MTLRHSTVALHQGLFGLLNLALTVPAVYLLLGLPLVMREHGWSALDIGLFQLTGLPALFKPLLAMPVEAGRHPQRRYPAWALACGGLYALVLLALALIGPAQRGLLVALALLAALLGTWADIPVNALAIRLLPAEERMRAGSIRSTVLFLAAVIGGGLMLVVYAHLGWAAPFVSMAALLALALAGLSLLPGPTNDAIATPRTRIGGTALKGFFTRPGALAWTAMLALHFPFVAAAWIFVKPLLLDQGFSTAQVAWLVGVLGGTVGALAAFASGASIRRWGIARALPAFLLLDAAGIGALALAIAIDASAATLIGGTLLVAAGVGGSSALGFGLAMHYARPGSRALDYGLQSGLVTLTRLLMAPLAGLLHARGGYVAMFAVLAAATFGVFLLSLALGGQVARGATATAR